MKFSSITARLYLADYRRAAASNIDTPLVPEFKSLFPSGTGLSIGSGSQGLAQDVDVFEAGRLTDGHVANPSLERLLPWVPGVLLDY